MLIWDFPDWMKEYLDFLPSMGDGGKEEQVRLIEKYMNTFEEDMDIPEIRIRDCVTLPVRLLESLHRERKLK